MTSQRGRQSALLLSILASVFVLISWSQPWFVFTTEYSTELQPDIPVVGQTAANPLSALGLLLLALLLLLPFVSPLWRKVLGVLVIAIGVSAGYITVNALISPIASSFSTLSAATAIGDLNSLSASITSEQTTAWPYLALVGGLIAIGGGLLIVVFSNTWRARGRKYQDHTITSLESSTPKIPQSTEASTESDSNIELWDSLSHGSDPTSK